MLCLYFVCNVDCDNKMINSQEYESFENHAVTIKKSMNEYRFRTKPLRSSLF